MPVSLASSHRSVVPAAHDVARALGCVGPTLAVSATLWQRAMFGLACFFSRRRRHTRSLCDWSSDVCSSDLLVRARKAGPAIVDDARRRSAELIVLGAPRRAVGGRRRLFGGTVDYVLREAPCRVLIDRKSGV